MHGGIQQVPARGRCHGNYRQQSLQPNGLEWTRLAASDTGLSTKLRRPIPDLQVEIARDLSVAELGTLSEGGDGQRSAPPEFSALGVRWILHESKTPCYAVANG